MGLLAKPPWLSDFVRQSVKDVLSMNTEAHATKHD